MTIEPDRGRGNVSSLMKAARLPLSARALEAWRQSPIGGAGLPQCDYLLEGAVEELVRAGDLIADGPRAPGRSHTLLVVSGVARIYRRNVGPDASGRQVTLGYRRTGQVIGVAQVLAPKLAEVMHLAAVEAITDCEVLHLPTDDFLSFVTSDPAVAEIMFAELGGTLLEAHDLLAENVFLPVRRRVARHLLDLAFRQDGTLKVEASQQDVANAIGSVREVVSRGIIRLRDEGLIRRDDNSYILVDPASLHRVASGEE
jgi:CRP-like cAMP-binding protein